LNGGIIDARLKANLKPAMIDGIKIKERFSLLANIQPT
jgi:hypothetical protein